MTNADLTEWICEEHPLKPWPHDDCPGPGMPASNQLYAVMYKQAEEIAGDFE